MADKKISQLPKINLISGSEVILPIVHDGTTQKMDVSTFAVFASQWSSTTGSNTFIGSQTITGNTSIGGNLTVAGKLTAQEVFTEITSASVIFESGSTIFGNTADDTHTITGTLILNGLAIGTAQLMAQTASQAAVNLGISSVTGSINATTSSFDNVFLGISSVTGSMRAEIGGIEAYTASLKSEAIVSSSTQISNYYKFAETASANTFYGNQTISGSLTLSNGQFNVITGSRAVTSSLTFTHNQSGPSSGNATLELRSNNNTTVDDISLKLMATDYGVYLSYKEDGVDYSVLGVESLDDNKIYLYRDTRLYNKSLVIDNNLTVKKDSQITGSLDILDGRFSVTSGSGELTSSLAFTHNTISPTQGYSLFTLRHINNDFNENFALKLFADDYIAKIQYEQNNVTYDILRTNLAGDVHLTQDTRVFGKGFTIDDSLLVKGVITGSILATNGVVSSSNQLFELNAFTGSVIGQSNTIAAFTSSVNFTTQSLNAQTGSQNSLNTSLGLITSSIYGEVTSFNSVFQRVSSTTGSINTTTSSFNSVFSQIGSTTSSLIGITNGLMAFTAALDSTYATDAQLYQLYQATSSIHSTTQSLNVQTGSQQNLNSQIGIATSSLNSVSASLIGITNGLMAFTAALDATYATDAQLYQLYQATASIHSTTQSLNTFTGSIQSEVGGIEAYTASLKSVALVSGSLIASSSYAVVADGARTIDISTTNTDTDAYPLFANVIGTTGVGVLGDSGLRYNAFTNTLSVIGNISATTYLGNIVSSSAQIGEIAGLQAYTASLKAAAIVSSSQQIKDYITFVENSRTSSMTVNSATYASNIAVNTDTTDTTLYPVFTSNVASNGSVGLKGNPSGSLFYNAVTQQLIVSGGGLVVTGSANTTGSINLIGKQTITGSLNVTGSLTINSGSITMPNRPAFRVIGTGGPVYAQAILSGSQIAVDYNQGNHFNTTTGLFTAPIAGLYQVNVVVRTHNNTNNTINQLIVYKSGSNTGGDAAQIMVEYGINTTMNHTGGSTISKLEVGDTLRAQIAVGTCSFDLNDNFSAAYIG